MLPAKYITSSVEGFQINQKAYEDFFQENGLQIKITHLLGTVNYNDDPSLERASKHIKNIIMEGSMSEKLVDEIFRSYSTISPVMNDATVNVSALLQNGNELNYSIKGEAILVLTVKEIWASLFDTTSLMDNQKASSLLHQAPIILVKILSGKNKIIKPAVVHADSVPVFLSSSSQTATRVYLDIAKTISAADAAKCQSDGIGFLRAETLMTAIGVHPRQMINEKKRHIYVEKLAEKIAEFAYAFSPRPVIYKTSNLKTSEYRYFKGGEAYEPIEANPMFGYRGAFRYIHDPELFLIELDAIKQVRNTMELKNIWIMLPFVRTVDELVEVKKIITEAGLYRSPSCKILMAIETPANIILLDKFIEKGIDGVSIEYDNLSMLTLGIDPNNSEVYHSKAVDEAVLFEIEKTIKTAHKNHVTVSLNLPTVASLDLLPRVVELGITSVSVHPGAITSTRETIAEVEKRLWQK